MYFDDLTLGMSVEIAPAVIENKKCWILPIHMTTFRCTPMKNTRKHLPLGNSLPPVWCLLCPSGQISGGGLLWQGTAGGQIHKNRMAQAGLCGRRSSWQSGDHQSYEEKCQKRIGGGHHWSIQPEGRACSARCDGSYRQMLGTVMISSGGDGTIKKTYGLLESKDECKWIFLLWESHRREERLMIY